MAGLTKDQINEIVSKSENETYIQKVISTNFENLDQPCSVSLGIGSFFEADGIHIKPDNEVLRITNMLRDGGIDAVPYNSSEAKDLNKFVVDPSGISTPVLNPQDAIQATVDIADVLRDNRERIHGYALPKTQENLTYYAAGQEKNVDIIKNNENTELAARINREYNCSTQDFVNKQLQSLSSLSKVSSEENDKNNNGKSIYSGRICSPYNVIANRRNRDLVYASPSMQTAQGYAKGGIGLSTGDYGFIAEYQASANQKFYEASEIEYAGKAEGPYETAVFAHQNKLKGVYLVDAKNNVYNLTDENGNYISKSWEDFMKLHEGYAVPENETMRQRGNNLKSSMATDASSIVKPYAKTPGLKSYSYDENISTEAYLENNFLKNEVKKQADGKYSINKDVKFTSSTGLPKCVSDLQFTNLTIQDLPLPEGLDLSDTTKTAVKSCTLPQDAKFGNEVCIKDCTIPDNYNLQNVTNLEFQSCNLGQNLTLPSKVCLTDTKLPENIDLSKVDLTLKSGNLETSLDDILHNQQVLNAQKLSLSGSYNLVDTALLPELKKHNLEDIKLLKLPDESSFTNLTQSGDIKVPCFTEKGDEFKSEILMKDVNISSANDIGKNRLEISTQIKLHGDCTLGGEMAEQMAQKPLGQNRFDYQAITSLHVQGNESCEIENLLKIEMPAQAPVKLSGPFAINEPQTLSNLQNCNLEEVKCLWPNNPKAFLDAAKEKNAKLPNDIPIIFESDGVVKIIAQEQAKEGLLQMYGSNVGKAIYITPEDFEKQTNIGFAPFAHKPQEKMEPATPELSAAEKIKLLRMGKLMDQAVATNVSPKEKAICPELTEKAPIALSLKELRGIGQSNKAPHASPQVQNTDIKALKYARDSKSETK